MKGTATVATTRSTPNCRRGWTPSPLSGSWMGPMRGTATRRPWRARPGSERSTRAAGSTSPSRNAPPSTPDPPRTSYRTSHFNRPLDQERTMTETIRLTVAQAVVKFIANQYTEIDGEQRRFIPAALGIFGHGNVAGLGQALEMYSDDLPFVQGRNEQSLVHMAT